MCLFLFLGWVFGCWWQRVNFDASRMFALTGLGNLQQLVSQLAEFGIRVSQIRNKLCVARVLPLYFL